MFDLARSTPVSRLALLGWACFSGITAVGWAFAFTRAMKILFLVIPLSWLLPTFLGRDFWDISWQKVPVVLFSLAQEIHARLVPTVDMSTPKYEIFWNSSPTREVGGDRLDVHADDDRTGICVADVSGHGAPPASSWQ